MTTEQNTDSAAGDLKTAREKSGLTLKDLFERTRISVVNLEAIENGDFHLLPVPIYTRNFIKTYANALGVDAKPVIQRYENYLHTLQLQEKARIEETPPHTQLVTAFSRHKASLMVLCIIIVFAAVSFIVSKHNKPSPDVPDKTESRQINPAESPLAQNAAQPNSLSTAMDLLKPENLITVSPTKQEEKTTEQKKITSDEESGSSQNEALADDEEPSTLTVHATEDTWIRIKADDKDSFQVMLKSGEKVSHKATRFIIDIGNAGGVKMQFNGKKIENLGKSGQVIHLRLP